jgi:hypothetical protein
MCLERGKLRSAPSASVPGTLDTYARRLQVALVSERLLFRVPGGWLRLTTKGQQLMSAQPCRRMFTLSHEARGECWRTGHSMCDMRPDVFKVVSGAIAECRFFKLCA